MGTNSNLWSKCTILQIKLGVGEEEKRKGEGQRNFSVTFSTMKRGGGRFEWDGEHVLNIVFDFR